MISEQAIKEKYDTIELMERRFKLLVGAKWEDKSELLKAVKEQDEIRERFSKKCKGWNSTAEIRKWRDNR
ncbi:MAG: hypothetical protein AB1797_13785 [bacterium]